MVFELGRHTKIVRVDRLGDGEIDGGKVELCAERVEGWTEDRRAVLLPLF